MVKVDDKEWVRYQREARALGFLEMAAAPVAPVRRAEAVTSWVANGFHGEMHWYARGLAKRLDPSLVVPGARSIIMLTTPYTREPCTLAGKKLARYACGDDYHDVLKERLIRLHDLIKLDHPGANLRYYVDTGPVLERYWAEQAGLGWIGKNGNLISRSHGSYLFLASMVTDLDLPTGQPHPPFCGACRACIDVCPTDAIVADGVVDSRRCISYLNIEHRGDFPAATPAFDEWLFGCDLCQEVCPWTRKFAAERLLDAFAPRPAYAELGGPELARMEQEQFSNLFRKSAVKRTKLAGLKRNLDHLNGSEPDEDQA